MSNGGNIYIGHNANGSVIVSGAHNTITIYTEHIITAQPAPAAAPAILLGPNPYRGLAAFQEEDYAVFFGREETTRQLFDMVARLFAQSAPLRLAALLGPSGSGKSSVARAGLLPQLARTPPTGVRKLRVALFSPTDDPIWALATILAKVGTPGDATPAEKAREFERVLLSAEHGVFRGLAQIAAMICPSREDSLLLLVDQFEETYSLCKKGDARATSRQAIFVANLLHAAACKAGHLAVLVTMRSDFFGETQRHPELGKAIADRHLLVSPMSAFELRDAIAKPAEVVGNPLDEATLDRLVAEVEGREGALPLLEFALTRIWDGFAEGQTAAETLRALGGVGGALAARAQEIFLGLDDDGDRQIAQRAFLGMVQLGEGAQDTRRRVQMRELVAHGEDEARVRAVLERFADKGARLLTLAAPTEGVAARGKIDAAAAGGISMLETVEVTHEALFQHWNQLRGWIDQGRDDLRLHRRAGEAALRWDALGRPGGLLWRPPDLELLQSYAARDGSYLTALEATFLRTAEAQRAAEAAELQRRTLEERARAQKEAHRRRRTVGVLSGITIVLAGLLTVSLWEYLRAQDMETSIAKSRTAAVRAVAETFLARGDIQIRDIVQASRTGILNTDFTTLQSLMPQLATGDGVFVFACVVDKDGIILAHSDPSQNNHQISGEIMKAAAEGKPIRIQPYPGHDPSDYVYVFGRPIALDGQAIGHAFIGLRMPSPEYREAVMQLVP